MPAWLSGFAISLFYSAEFLRRAPGAGEQQGFLQRCTRAPLTRGLVIRIGPASRALLSLGR
jgi:hypothetical protein